MDVYRKLRWIIAHRIYVHIKHEQETKPSIMHSLSIPILYSSYPLPSVLVISCVSLVELEAIEYSLVQVTDRYRKNVYSPPWISSAQFSRYSILTEHH